MANYPGIYKGANYGFDSPYENDPFGAPIGDRYALKAGQFGVTTDPRSANQLKEVSDKLSTGAKTIEVSGISTEVLESIPEQHLREIARLKKLAGADITFHGPLVEPTGFNQQGNWDESLRLQAERQIWDAIKRGQVMNEDGNLVVTLHTSNGLKSPQTIMKKEGMKGVENGEKSNIFVIDEYSGKAGILPQQLLEPDKFEGQTVAPKTEEAIESINKKIWRSAVENMSLEVMRGRDAVNKALFVSKKDEEGGDIGVSNELSETKKLFKLYRDDPEMYNHAVDSIKDPLFKSQIESRITNLAHGHRFLQNSYDSFKDLYSKATEALRNDTTPKGRESMERLEKYKKEVSASISQYQEDPLKIKEFEEQLEKGFRVLSNLPKNPSQYKPIEEFAIDKASQTFSKVALNAYKQFGDNAPILSLENPPVGMGLSRADEIVNLVKATRTKLTNDLVSKEGLSQQEASKTAQKLIGVTWDVGHINMLKKYGFDDTDIVNETQKIKPYLKHVHLSDNFGLEHTELPMGMGNVPMKGHMEAIGSQIKDMKAIIETGGHWYQDFKTSPLPETLAAFGSQLYPMQMQPHWDQAQARTLSTGYFSGYGTNPDVHHSIYGAGFSNLPKELGGQIGGRNRLSGNPLE